MLPICLKWLSLDERKLFGLARTLFQNPKYDTPLDPSLFPSEHFLFNQVNSFREMLLIINAFVIKALASSGEYRRPRGLGLCRGCVLKATKWFFRNKADGLLCQSSG